jgi:hypothetical protein
MDRYSWERWTLEQHHEMARNAEERARLAVETSQATLADRLAVRLRLLADRLDGRTSLTVVSGPR